LLVPQYLPAQNQFAGVGADIRSDLYSLGVTLWMMLAGQPPFEALLRIGAPAFTCGFAD